MYTCICALLCIRCVSSLNPNISALQSGNLPYFLLQFFFFFHYVSGCVRMYVFCIVCFYRSGYEHFLWCCFLMSRFITSSDPQAAQGAGRLPGKGFRPDDTAECQCKNKHANTPEYLDTYTVSFQCFSVTYQIRCCRRFWTMGIIDVVLNFNMFLRYVHCLFVVLTSKTNSHQFVI